MAGPERGGGRARRLQVFGGLPSARFGSSQGACASAVLQLDCEQGRTGEGCTAGATDVFPVCARLPAYCGGLLKEQSAACWEVSPVKYQPVTFLHEDVKKCRRQNVVLCFDCYFYVNIFIFEEFYVCKIALFF